MKYHVGILFLVGLTFLPNCATSQIIDVFECNHSDTLWFNANLVKFPAIEDDCKTYIIELDGGRFVDEVRINEPDCQTTIRYWSKDAGRWSYLVQTDSDELIYWPTNQYEASKYIMVKTKNKKPVFMEILFR